MGLRSVVVRVFFCRRLLRPRTAFGSREAGVRELELTYGSWLVVRGGEGGGGTCRLLIDLSACQIEAPCPSGAAFGRRPAAGATAQTLRPLLSSAHRALSSIERDGARAFLKTGAPRDLPAAPPPACEGAPCRTCAEGGRADCCFIIIK